MPKYEIDIDQECDFKLELTKGKFKVEIETPKKMETIKLANGREYAIDTKGEFL